MTIDSFSIAQVLVERIEAYYPAGAHFLLSELRGWRAGVVATLTGSGVLQPAAHAEAVVCPGCDWQCHKRVSVRKMAAAPVPVAYISCDEEPDHGAIFIDVRDRVQYRATLSDLSGFIAKLLKLGPPRASASGATLFLGSMGGRHGVREVSIALDAGRVHIRIGRQSLPLVEVLSCDRETFAIDKKRIYQLAHRKLASETSSRSDRSRQQRRSREIIARNRAIFHEAKRQREATGESWSRIAATLAIWPLALTNTGRKLSAARVRRIISDLLRLERE